MVILSRKALGVSALRKPPAPCRAAFPALTALGDAVCGPLASPVCILHLTPVVAARSCRLPDLLLMCFTLTFVRALLWGRKEGCCNLLIN